MATCEARGLRHTHDRGLLGTTGWHNASAPAGISTPRLSTDDGPQRTGDLCSSSRNRTWPSRPVDALRLGRRGPPLPWPRGRRREASDRGTATAMRRRILAAMSACRFEPAIPAATTGQRTAFHVLCRTAECPTLRSGTAGTRRFWRLSRNCGQWALCARTAFDATDRHDVRTLLAFPEGARVSGQ